MNEIKNIGIMSALSLALRVNSRKSWSNKKVRPMIPAHTSHLYLSRRSFSSKRAFTGLSSSPIASFILMKTYEDAYPLFWILGIGMFILGFVVCLFITEDRWK